MLKTVTSVILFGLFSFSALASLPLTTTDDENDSVLNEPAMQDPLLPATMQPYVPQIHGLGCNPSIPDCFSGPFQAEAIIVPSNKTPEGYEIIRISPPATSVPSELPDGVTALQRYYFEMLAYGQGGVLNHTGRMNFPSAPQSQIFSPTEVPATLQPNSLPRVNPAK